MFITRKTDYGLRVMLALGCRPGERLTSETIAEITEVPRAFILKILQTLTHSGLIKAQRGVGGGIQLARTPESISLYEIIRAIDTPRALNACLLDPSACTRAPHCAAHQGLRRVQDVLDQELRNITLGNLVSEQLIIDETMQRRSNPA